MARQALSSKYKTALFTETARGTAAIRAKKKKIEKMILTPLLQAPEKTQ